MKTWIRHALFSILFAFPLFASAAPPAGLWHLQGQSAEHGPYEGQIEFRPTPQGLQVVRLATYRNFSFQGLQVQEIWQGVVDASGKAVFHLSQSGYITQVDGYSVPPDHLNSSLEIKISYKALSPSSWQGSFADGIEFLDQPQALPAKPLWQNQRQALDAKGSAGVPLPIRAAMALSKSHSHFKENPLVLKSAHHPEFLNENPYVILDPTDFIFYRQHPTLLRIVNRSLDPAALTEALMRHHAYAPPLTAKAAGLEEDTQAVRLNPYGIVSTAILDGDNHLQSQAEDYDSALWTGMYAGAEAMRYLTTHETAALENFKRTLKGIFLLLNITNDPKEFARSVMPYKGHENMGPRWHRGQGTYSDMVWLDGGNNDMLKGIDHALMWAAIILPDSERALRADLARASLRLLDLKVPQEKKSNLPSTVGLAAWLTQDPRLKQRYLEVLKDPSVRLSGYSWNANFYWNGIADWSGVNLTVVGFITDINVADHLGFADVRDQFRERLMEAWGTYAPSYYSLMTLAAYKYAFSGGLRGPLFERHWRDDDFFRRLDHAVWSLREYPYPRPQQSIAYDHSLSSDWSANPLPGMFWKTLLKKAPSADPYVEGLYNYPIFESTGISDNFIWKDQFGFRGQTAPSRWNGIDYLYAYWLARFAGLKLE